MDSVGDELPKPPPHSHRTGWLGVREAPGAPGTCISQTPVHQANCVQSGGGDLATREGIRHGFLAGTDPGPGLDLVGGKGRSDMCPPLVPPGLPGVL